MNDRQKDILTFVINEYIKSAQPVGSNLLSEKSEFDLSPATFRNELVALEEEGFLVQPHTSAGRIPTEKAYKYYADNCLVKMDLDTRSAKDLKINIREQLETNQLLKDVAKQLVEQVDEAVIVAFNKDDIYYTGLSNLFAKPEFNQQQIVSISSVVDHLDNVIDGMFDQVENIEVLVGKSNPFGNQCSTIVGKYTLKGNITGMFAILGPMRMNYQKNLALMRSVQKLLGGMEENN